jgi:putative proteasome-type protease
MSDTRTNSGVDYISSFRKLHHWTVPGNRTIALLSSGNLATTQAVVSKLEERGKTPDDRHNSLLDAPTMFQVATLVGEILRETIRESTPSDTPEASGTFTASFILAGQIAGMEPRLFLIYPEGNFIEASSDTPFFQIGENKYGRPILIRAYDPAMSFEDAVKLLMVSFDSTIKANLSVGMPLDLMILEKDRVDPLHSRRIAADDEYFRSISSGWSDALRKAFEALPDYEIPAGK